MPVHLYILKITFFFAGHNNYGNNSVIVCFLFPKL